MPPSLSLAIANTALYIVEAPFFLGAGRGASGEMHPLLVIPFLHFLFFAFCLAFLGVVMAWQERHKRMAADLPPLGASTLAMGLHLGLMAVSLAVFAGLLVRGQGL